MIVAKGINNIIVLTIVISFLSRITIHLIQEAMIFLPFFALSLNATPFFFIVQARSPLHNSHPFPSERRSRDAVD